METTERTSTERTLQDLGAAVREGEEALRDIAGENGHVCRAKLRAALDRAKALYDRIEDKTLSAAKATDKAVHDHPYQAIGIAFGLGLLVGVLAVRSRRD